MLLVQCTLNMYATCPGKSMDDSWASPKRIAETVSPLHLTLPRLQQSTIQKGKKEKGRYSMRKPVDFLYHPVLVKKHSCWLPPPK